MSERHLSDEELHDYVSNMLGPERCVYLEAHVRGCELCAHKLYRSAEAEEVLYSLAPRRRFATSFFVGGLAAAAMLALLVGAVWRSRAALTPEVCLVDVICPDGNDQNDCIREAHAHGRFVAYPAFAGGPAIAALEPNPEGEAK